MSSEGVEALARALGGSVQRSRTMTTVSVDATKVVDACSGVASMPRFYHLTTITALDRGQSIELRYHFWGGREFVTIRTEVRKEDLAIESVSSALPAATLYEAEIQDLFGVLFRGNPYTGKRLLLPDSYPAGAPPPLRAEADPQKVRKLMGLE